MKRYCIVCRTGFTASRIDQIYHHESCWKLLRQKEAQMWKAYHKALVAQEFSCGKCHEEVKAVEGQTSVSLTVGLVILHPWLDVKDIPDDGVVAMCKKCRGEYYRELALSEDRRMDHD